MTEDKSTPANPEADRSVEAPVQEGQPTQPQSLSDTQPDVTQVLGSRSPQAEEERLHLAEQPQELADGE